jgi:hypothetical protein
MVKAVVADEARIKAFEDGVASSGALRSQVLPIASQAEPGRRRRGGGCLI